MAELTYTNSRGNLNTIKEINLRSANGIRPTSCDILEIESGQPDRLLKGMSMGYPQSYKNLLIAAGKEDCICSFKA